MLADLFSRPYEEVSRDARLSPCLRYRYLLSRWWDDSLRWALWIMLNPSTADAGKDDPTIRRCIGFSRAWGMGGFAVVNLFAFRSPRPADLRTAADPVGPECDDWIRTAIGMCAGPVVAGWGKQKVVTPARLRALAGLIPQGRQVVCLGTNGDGSPKHPLYVPAATTPIPFELPGGEA